jgi:hypothetical protein
LNLDYKFIGITPCSLYDSSLISHLYFFSSQDAVSPGLAVAVVSLLLDKADHWGDWRRLAQDMAVNRTTSGLLLVDLEHGVDMVHWMSKTPPTILKGLTGNIFFCPPSAGPPVIPPDFRPECEGKTHNPISDDVERNNEPTPHPVIGLGHGLHRGSGSSAAVSSKDHRVVTNERYGMWPDINTHLRAERKKAIKS